MWTYLTWLSLVRHTSNNIILMANHKVTWHMAWEPLITRKMKVLTFWACSSEVVASVSVVLFVHLLTQAPTVSADIGTFAIPLAGELRQVGGALCDTTWLPRCCSARSSSSNEIIWAGTRFRRRWSDFCLQLVSKHTLYSYIPTLLTITIRGME